MKMNKQKGITQLEYESSLWPKTFNSPQKYHLILWYSDMFAAYMAFQQGTPNNSIF